MTDAEILKQIKEADRFVPDTADALCCCQRLYDMNLVKINPPGWAFKLSDKGRAVLEAMTEMAK